MAEGLRSEDIEHFPPCSPNYPEKDPGEAPRAVNEVDVGDGYKALVCVDCGASVTNLPPLEDPYWDDVREELAR